MLRALDSSYTPKSRYDVAIVGAGPAGITLALTLARKGRTVFLAEGGGLEVSKRSQDIYRGRVLGDPYHALDGARLRYFGGTSGHWGGVCRPLDAQDFEAKPANPDTAWPISIADLKPYEDGARRVLGLPRFPLDHALPNTKRLRQVSWIWSDPIRFGDAFRQAVRDSAEIDAVLDCNYVGLAFEDGAAKRLIFRNWDGRTIQINAAQTVFACGGIENARILLIENARYRNALGNQGGAVGGYWMDHPTYRGGHLVVFDRARFHNDMLGREICWGPTPQVLRERGMLNACVKLYPDDAPAKRVMKDLLCVAPELSQSALSLFGRTLYCGTGTLNVQWEQEPSAANRIMLDFGAIDPFGRPRIKHVVRKTPLDRRTGRLAAMEVARYVAEENIARVKLAPWVLDEDAPYPDDDEMSAVHLIGGARMAESTANGVVDKDCRVFGTRNVYVAGSSVFPSGGFANPTFTIIQLTLRLGDHLHAQLSKPAIAGAAMRATLQSPH